jgi:hypothetical protein
MSSDLPQNSISVEAIVRNTLLRLRRSSNGLDDFLAGPFAEMAIRQTFNQGADELLAMINAAPQGGYIVGQQLISLMEHNDPGMRALATFFTGLAGIPLSLTASYLQQRLQVDNSLAVKIAAAVHLQSRYDDTTSIPANIRKFARKFVVAYLNLARQEPGRVSLNIHYFNSDDEDGGDPDRAAAFGMMYMMQMLNYIPRIIAVQRGDV